MAAPTVRKEHRVEVTIRKYYYPIISMIRTALTIMESVMFENPRNVVYNVLFLKSANPIQFRNNYQRYLKKPLFIGFKKSPTELDVPREGPPDACEYPRPLLKVHLAAERHNNIRYRLLGRLGH